MASSSLQRSGQGLWFTACGRFSIRRLGSGQWAVAAVGARDRIGGFTLLLSSKLVSQRFDSLLQARQSVELACEMEAEKSTEEPGEWVRSGKDFQTTHKVRMALPKDNLFLQGSLSDLTITASRKDSLWKIDACPCDLAARDDDDDFARSVIRNRFLYFLGQARTLKEAQRIVAQELAYQWPALQH